MSAPFIFMNTHAIKEGGLTASREANPRWLQFLEANHPRVLHLGVYANEDGEVTAVQVHPDAGSMELQMRVISGRHEQWYEFIDWSKLRIQDLGTPATSLCSARGRPQDRTCRSASTRRWTGLNRLPEL